MHRRVRDVRNQRGVLLIWLALFLVALVGLISLGVDVAKLMGARTQLQNAADAAALSGASALTPSGGFSPDTALARAQLTASLNRAYTDAPTPVIVSNADVSIDTTRRTVQVTTRRDPSASQGVITYFAKVFGINSLLMTATAMAKADPAGRLCDDLMPLVALADSTHPWTAGLLDTLSYNTVSPAPGNFGLLSFNGLSCSGLPPNPGGAGLKDVISGGLDCCVSTGLNQVVTKPGATVGPLNQGLATRYDLDGDRTPGELYSAYLANPLHTGQRVLVLPMLTSWADVAGGRTGVTIKGFVSFFMTYPPKSSQIFGEFIDYVRPGMADSTATSLVYTVHLIK